MAIQTSKGNLVIININTTNPEYFWNGTKLTEVIGLVVHTDRNEDPTVKIRVLNTVNFDSIYTEMTNTGIIIKKKN